MNTDISSSRPWAAGIAAAKANVLPGVILWIAGVLILLAWFTWPPAQRFLQHVADLKVHYGYLYSAIATAIFAGVIPVVMQRLFGRPRQPQARNMLLFLVLFWAYRGAEVDLLYRLQSHWFGDGYAWPTLAAKIVIDQLVYCPLWAVPTMAWALEWVQKDRRGEAVPGGPATGRKVPMAWRQWYLVKVVPVLIPNWFVWVPAVAMIYAMPPALQLPIQNLVACLWVMMVLFMTKPAEAPPGTRPFPLEQASAPATAAAAAPAEGSPVAPDPAS
ncbi:MAG: hypothetical protein WD042_04255 [Phycisphaeraceae bacterium]